VLDTLDALGLAERTLVAYTADHGEMAGEHGLYQKFVFYEGAARVPLLIRPPAPGGAAPGPRTVAEPLDLTCLVPTFLDVCGLAPPAPDGPRPLQGRSVAHLLRPPGPVPAPPAWSTGVGADAPAAFSEMWYGDGPAAMVRQGQWKLARYATGERTLFDLASDPGEARDLAGNRAAAAVEDVVHQRLLAWKPSLAAAAPVPAAR
jgi:choline-sulfatase